MGIVAARAQPMAPSHFMTDPANPPRVALTSLRALSAYLRAYPGLIAAWLTALVVSSSATLALPVAVRFVIDRGFRGDAAAEIDRWFVGLLGVAVVLALATAARFYFVSLLGERVVADLRARVYAHLMRLDLEFFETTRSGELLSRLSADSELLRTVVASSASVALRSVVILIGSAVALTLTSPRLAGLASIGIPLIVLPIVLFGRRVQARSKISQDRVADSQARAGETLNAMATVKSFARESFESTRFADAVSQAYAAARMRVRLQALLTAVVIVLVFGAITAVLWSGARNVIAGEMTPGVLGQFVLYALIGAGSVGALTEVWSEVQRAAGGMARLQQLLDEQPLIAAPAAPRALPGRLTGAIEFDDVTFRYPSRPDTAALDHFSLRVEPGETIALVGPSGAGKSTVLALLLRMFDAQSGVIRVDGIDLREVDPVALRSQLALVPQDPVIFGADALDNIRYGRLEADDAAVERAARQAEAHEFLARLPEGYKTFLGEHGARLSGGQRQRIAIARALLKDAPILLLDEATSALDSHSERAIQLALEHAMEGRTTLVIAHRLATVLKADRIVVLEGGCIVAIGNHAELIAQGGLYAELARLQFHA